MSMYILIGEGRLGPPTCPGLYFRLRARLAGPGGKAYSRPYAGWSGFPGPAGLPSPTPGVV